MSKVSIFRRLPSVAEYNRLRQSVEWPIPDVALVEKALQNSLYGVVAEDKNGLAIGMGRVVGDDAIYLHIQDVIISPVFQRQGVGRRIMAELMDYVDGQGGKHTNIGLMSSVGREKFYKTFGFIERPTEKFGAGMIKI